MSNTATAAIISIEINIEARVRVALTQLREAEVQVVTAEMDAKRATDRAARCHEEAQRRRLELGRLLLKARPNWPERGPNAKGWGQFLARLEIHEQSAREWMDLAEEIEISKPEDGGLEMTRAAVQANKRAREQEPDPKAHSTAREGAEFKVGLTDLINGRSLRPIAKATHRGLIMRRDVIADRDACAGYLWQALRELVVSGGDPYKLTERLRDPVQRGWTWQDFKAEDRREIAGSWAATFREIANVLDQLSAEQEP